MASYWFDSETVQLDVGGRPMTIETGRMAKQAAGSVVVTYGDTVVLVTATSAKPREGIDFFPLTVDYVEKMYAGGKIPGGFFRREGALGEKEILTSRFIDRSLKHYLDVPGVSKARYSDLRKGRWLRAGAFHRRV